MEIEGSFPALNPICHKYHKYIVWLFTVNLRPVHSETQSFRSTLFLPDVVESVKNLLSSAGIIFLLASALFPSKEPQQKENL